MTSPDRNEATAILSVVTDTEGVNEFLDSLSGAAAGVEALRAPFVQAIGRLAQDVTPAAAAAGRQMATALEQGLASGLSDIRGKLAALEAEMVASSAATAFVRSRNELGQSTYTSSRFQITQQANRQWSGRDLVAGDTYAAPTLTSVKSQAAAQIAREYERQTAAHRQLVSQFEELQRTQALGAPILSGLQRLPAALSAPAAAAGSDNARSAQAGVSAAQEALTLWQRIRAVVEETGRALGQVQRNSQPNQLNTLPGLISEAEAGGDPVALRSQMSALKNISNRALAANPESAGWAELASHRDDLNELIKEVGNLGPAAKAAAEGTRVIEGEFRQLTHEEARHRAQTGGAGSGSGGGGRGRIPSGSVFGEDPDFDPMDPRARTWARRNAERPFMNAAFPNGFAPNTGKGAFGGFVDMISGGVGNLGGFVKYFAELSGAIAIFSGIERGLQAAIAETFKYDAASRDLNFTLDGTSRSGGAVADSLANIATGLGFSPSAGIQAGTVALQMNRDQRTALNGQDIAQTGATVGSQAGLLAGIDPTTAEQQLGAVTQAYQLSFNDQRAILNQAVVAHERYGTSVKDILQGTAQLAQTAAQAHVPVGVLTQAVGDLSAKLQRPGGNIATELASALQGAGSSTVQTALRNAGIGPSGNAYNDLEKLSKRLSSMTAAQQSSLYKTLGGRNSVLGTFLRDMPDIQAGAGEAQQKPSAYLDAVQRAMQGADKTLKEFQQDLLNLGVSITRTGLLDPFIMLARLLDPPIKLLNEFMQLLDRVPLHITQIITSLAEVAALAALIKRSFGVDLAGGLLGGFAPNRAMFGPRRAEQAKKASGLADAASEKVDSAETAVQLAAARRAQAATRYAEALTKAGRGTVQEQVAAANLVRAEEKLVAATEQLAVARAEERAATATAVAAASKPGVAGILADEALVASGAAGAAKASRLSRIKNVFTRGSRATGVASEAGALAEAETVAGSGAATGAFRSLGAVAGPATIALIGLADGVSYLRDKTKKMNEAIKADEANVSTSAASASTPEQARKVIDEARRTAAELKATEDPTGLAGGPEAWFHDIFGSNKADHEKRIAQQQQTIKNMKGVASGGRNPQAQQNAIADLIGDITGENAIPNALSSLQAIGVTPEAQAAGLRTQFRKLTKDQLAANPQLAGAYITAQNQLATQAATSATNRTGIAVEGDYAAQEAQSLHIQDLRDKGFGDDSEQIKLAQQQMDAINNQLNSDLHGRYQALADMAASNRTSDDTVGQITDQINGLVTAMQNDKPDSDQYVTDSTKLKNLLKQKAQAQLQAALPNDLAKLDPRDQVGRTSKQIENLRKQLATMTPGSKEYGDTLDQINQLTQQNFTAGQTLMTQQRSMQYDPRDRTALAKLAAQQAWAQYQHDRGSPAEAASYNAALAAQAQSNASGLSLAGQQYTAANVNPLFSGQQTHAARVIAYGNLMGSYDQNGRPTDDTAAAQVAMNQANAQQAQYDTAAGSSRFRAGLDQGSAVDKAAGDLHDAANQLNLYQGDKNSKEYNDALIAYHQAQLEVADTARQTASVARQLGGDITDPVFMAADALKTARQKLTDDIARNAKPDVQKADRLDVVAKDQATQAAQFQQNLSQMQTNDQLGRISHQTYLKFLAGEHDRLTQRLAAMKKGDQGYQQLVDELNQTDQSIKDANNQLAGQFNLGDIKVPTVYDVRRQMANTAAGLSAPHDNRVTTVTVNGADFARVVAYLQTALGTPGASRVNVTASPGGF